MTHTHKAKTEDGPYPFRGTVNPHNPTPVAHGGSNWTYRCACGASKQVNHNGGEKEHGPWGLTPASFARTTHYTTTGSVRGSCGHKHRSRELARACIARDHRGCEAQGGYSDRRVVKVTHFREK